MLIFLSRTIFRFSKNNFTAAIESLRDEKLSLQGLSFSPANSIPLEWLFNLKQQILLTSNIRSHDPFARGLANTFSQSEDLYGFRTGQPGEGE